MASSPSIAFCGAFGAALESAHPIGIPFFRQPLKRSELVSTSHWLHIPRAQHNDSGSQSSEELPRKTTATTSLRIPLGNGGKFGNAESSQSVSALHAVASRDAPVILREPGNRINTSPETVEEAAEPRFVEPSAPDALEDPAQLPRVSSASLHYPPGFLGAVPMRQESGEGAALIDDLAGPYLRMVLTSKVYDVAIKSPLELTKKLSKKVGNKVYLKREDMQQVFSFKLRGAYNMMAKLTPEELQRGVICSSAGNHAQGVALAAARLGCNAVIAMPVTTPDIKWKSVKELGAEVVLVGEAYDETQAYAKQRALDEGRVFVPPFDHPDIIAGQGTVGMEILMEHPGPLHAVFVPVGGGGLIAGMAAYIKSLRPEVLVIGVEPVDANAMALSLHHGRRVELDAVGKFADGVAVKVVGEETFRLCQGLLDGIVLVSTDAICAAIKDVFEEARSILEPAGALALAGAKAYCGYYGVKGESVVAVTSGANMNFNRLRMVSELSDVGATREAVLVTTMPERRGAFRKFSDLVGSTNITEFHYRYNDDNSAHVMYRVGLREGEEVGAVIHRMRAGGYKTEDFTENDLAKRYSRSQIEGGTPMPHEVFFSFVIPERPGALARFLEQFSPQWNITSFFYREQGEAGADILVAFQVLPEEEVEFRQRADELGYKYQDERENEFIQMFRRKK